MEEFKRQLDYLPASYPWNAERDHYIVSMPSGCRGRIDCRSLAPTRLGSLSLPLLQVSMSFDDACPPAEQRSFIDTLRGICQRGGG